jgi:hypothetical protein
MSDVPFRRVNAYEDLQKPGDGYWDAVPPTRLHFLCPCGCGSLAGITVSGEYPWQWNGDLEKPTATPSILINKDSGCAWHGHLTDGVFKSC